MQAVAEATVAMMQPGRPRNPPKKPQASTIRADKIALNITEPPYILNSNFTVTIIKFRNSIVKSYM